MLKKCLILLDFCSRFLPEYEIQKYLPESICIEKYEVFIMYSCLSKTELQTTTNSNLNGFLYNCKHTHFQFSRYDVVVNLLSTDHRDLNAYYTNVKEYYDLASFPPPSHRRLREKTVISVSADGKHAGKTTLTNSLLKHSILSNICVDLLVIERCPRYIVGKSGFDAYTNLIKKHHIIRLGENSDKTCNIRGDDMPCFDSNIVIIDNSGGTIAPIIPNIRLHLSVLEGRKYIFYSGEKNILWGIISKTMGNINRYIVYLGT